MESFLQEEVNKFMKEKNKSNISASDYQKQAKETAIFPPATALEYLTLGLVGEAGEIANKVKYLTSLFTFGIYLLLISTRTCSSC